MRYTISMSSHTISFRNAWQGLVTATTTQQNIRIHLVAFTLVCLLALLLKVTRFEGLIILLTVSTVIVAELINTALEYLANAVTLKHDDNIKRAKDISAGAVLVSAIFSVIVGVIIFLPKLISLITNL